MAVDDFLLMVRGDYKRTIGKFQQEYTYFHARRPSTNSHRSSTETHLPLCV